MDWTNGSNFLKAWTNLVNVILKGKVPDHLPYYFFGGEMIALKKPAGVLRPVAICNTRRQLSEKCAGCYCLGFNRRSFQVGVGTRRGAELASHVFCT